MQTNEQERQGSGEDGVGIAPGGDSSIDRAHKAATAAGTAVVKHNAKFTPTIVDAMKTLLKTYQQAPVSYILDPMGGTGGVFNMHDAIDCGIDLVEIEHEWAVSATLHPLADPATDQVHNADFLKWADEQSLYWVYDFVVTSPTYGNRMADHHDAKDSSKRNTYKHTLGRNLTKGSSAGMQWGDEYREFHEKAWRKVWDLLTWDGCFIINVKDHIRKGKRQPVSTWHRKTLENIGFTWETTVHIPVTGNRQGANGSARVDEEQVHVFKKTRPEGDVS